MIESIERLKQMKNRPWVYRNSVVEILGYADGVGEDGDEVEIYLNDGRTIECRITELSSKLKEFGSATGQCSLQFTPISSLNSSNHSV